MNSTPSSEKLFGAGRGNKFAQSFRDYQTKTRSTVKELYQMNHANQTVEFVLHKKAAYRTKTKIEMGVWQAIEQLSTLVDDSDPDTDVPQIEHNLQTAEAIRRDGHPRWFILTGLIHDLGKILSFFGEPQWAVVGDTFPVGCAYSQKIVYPELFAANPDSQNPLYQTRTGIYAEGCGLDNVHFSWGHDEYLYQVMKAYLPEESLYMIRYHSCYVIHQQHEYAHLMNGQDKHMFDWVRAFSPYDLYSKGEQRPDIDALRPYYEALVAEFLPEKLRW
ncbi:MAG: inositol oxygenase family protein [Acidobacteriota bacterium]